MNQFEREQNDLYESHANGEISDSEYSREMREMERSYRAEAEESAQDAYDNEMNQW